MPAASFTRHFGMHVVYRMIQRRLSLLLVGSDRKLRPLFRALIYAALAIALMFLYVGWRKFDSRADT